MTPRKDILKKRDVSGYTLVEVLVVIAIVIALIVIAAIAIVNIQDHLRQKELDSKAETIYVAAQQRMIELRAAGYEDLYQYKETTESNGVKKLGLIPCDASEDNTSITDETLYYIDSTKESGTYSIAAADLLPEGSVDEELRANQWHIDYDPESGSIYGVFYSEEDAIPSDLSTCDKLRIKKQRLKQGALVGYYGGDLSEISSTETLYPGITVENKEQLKVTFYCNNPSPGEDLTFEITLTDGQNTYKRTITNPERVSSRTYRYVWVLDSLESEASRFYEQTEHKLKCGTDLKISLTVTSSDALVDAASVDRTTNSLFDYREDSADDTALISYARHLQNLDSASHVDDSITKAQQISDISFADNVDDDKDWYSLYGATFTPIENASLTSYDGKSDISGTEVSTAIYGLTIKDHSTAPAALFKTYAGEIKNTTLTGVRIAGGSDVGALIGQVTGATTLNNCQVYLSARQGDLDDIASVDTASEVSPWIVGNTAGGLIGRASAPVTLNNSSASTVVRGTMRAGGLIGQVEGDVTATGVYADCYLLAPTTGGLFGAASANASIKLENFYTVGYLVAMQSAAGIVPGTITSAKNGYTACSFETSQSARTYATAALGTATNVYYLLGANPLAGTTQISYAKLSQEGTTLLGSAFTSNSGGASYPYNLLDQGLSTYTYPRLSALAHYGDWQAEFESGKLVYFERYADGTYAFAGANTSTLSNSKLAVGDGYALAYTPDTLPDTSSTITVSYEAAATSGSYTLSTATTYTVTSGNDTYYLVLLPKEATNPALGTAQESFYQKITVQDALGETQYYYNPYFAKTVTTNDKTPSAPTTISVRTARQLNALSIYYQKYAVETASSRFDQELDIDYGSYLWSTYALSNSVTEQAPITSTGVTDGFVATYNGAYHTISGVSVTSSDAATGFFGTLGSTGALRNIFLTAQGGETISRTTSDGKAASGSRNSSQVGALVGVNRGNINNCAVCGYTITYYGYNSNVVVMGGLVGDNKGTIRASSADTPSIVVTSNSATAYVGGFVGRNTGSVSTSYSTGHVGVLDARSSTVWAAGFVGENSSGAVRASYSACAVTASGTAETYGFARIGGAVSDCYYLDEGTYSYAGDWYAYNTSVNEYAREGLSAATRIMGDELKSLSLGGFTSAYTSYCHDKTSGNYLYPTSVNYGGTYAHFGNWPLQQFIGSVGVFYWEYEEYGSNSGYHFSYIGYDSSVISGDSLCEEHDDGGVVTSYGYGYFYETGASAPTITTSNTSLGTENATAGAALHDQMSAYTFVAYETGEDDSQLHTTAFERNSTWTLQSSASGTTVTYTFELCPFFGNAMSLKTIKFAGSTAQDMSGITPGEAGNTYEIRSEAQLQFMNWNSTEQTATYSITSDNYDDYTGSYRNRVYTRDRYPYLLSGDPDNIPTKSEQLYWVQSHDVDAYAENDNKDVSFTPIGSMYDGNNNSPNAQPYVSFFPYSFDGQAYAIKNIAISSTNQAVGLFGVTAGAQLQNIVMYSDQGNEIVKESGGSGWYTMGGLVGFAGSRKASATSETDSFFKNCTVSGYTIIDRYGQDPGWGGGNVGGLVGTTNMDINNCSAVNDIELRITYNGSYKNLRVGGVAGVCRATINSCYAGGSIESYDEQYDAGGEKQACIWVGGVCGGIVVRSTGKLADLLGYVDRSLLVTNCYSYVDLPAGPSYAGESGYKHVRASMSIASNGEMLVNWFGRNDNPSSDAYVPARDVYIYNSYAFGDSVSNTTDYKNYKSATSYNNKDLNPLDSGSSKCHVYMYNSSSPYLSYEDMTKSMLDKLNTTVNAKYDYVSAYRTSSTTTSTTNVTKTGDFDTVTTTEHGVAIDGKYSFPGIDTELKGLNYPFPTVLTQTDVFGNTVNVHYGAWPKNGIFWEQSSATYNLYANRQKDPDTGEMVSLMTMKLRVYGTMQNTLSADNISFTDDAGNPLPASEQPLEVYSISSYKSEGTSQGYYEVTFKGLRTGSAFVKASLDGYEAQTQITVENELIIKASDTKMSLEPGEEKSVGLTFYAPDATGAEQQIKPSNTAMSWDVVIKSGDDVVICDNDTVSYNATTGTLTLGAIARVIEDLDKGNAHVAITCTYQYGTGDSEKMSATQDIIIEVASPDFAYLKLDDSGSGYTFLYAYTSSDISSIGQLAQKLTDVNSALFLRNVYAQLNAPALTSFAIKVDGVEYAADATGKVYRTTAGSTQQELIAQITLGAKQDNSTYNYSYYTLSVSGYTLSEDATLVAHVRDGVSLEAKIAPASNLDTQSIGAQSKSMRSTGGTTSGARVESGM